jgi:hypothetical protein
MELTMSAISNEKAFDRAIDLVKLASQLTLKWTSYLITVQTSLVTLEGAILAWRSNAIGAAVLMGSMLVAALGALSVYVLTNIVIREHEYGHMYIQMAIRAEQNNPILFGNSDPPVTGKKFVVVMRLMRYALLIVWAVVFIVSAVLLFK